MAAPYTARPLLVHTTPLSLLVLIAFTELIYLSLSHSLPLRRRDKQHSSLGPVELPTTNNVPLSACSTALCAITASQCCMARTLPHSRRRRSPLHVHYHRQHASNSPSFSILPATPPLLSLHSSCTVDGCRRPFHSTDHDWRPGESGVASQQ